VFSNARRVLSQRNVRLRLLYLLNTTHVTISWRFKILPLGEIGRQLVKAPLTAAISPYLISPTHPTHA